MSRKTFLYIRVSTLDQIGGAESQARALNEWCSRNNIIDFETFTDHGVSGAKESRPALDKMMERVKNLEAEQVIVFAFSRFARSTMHLLKGLQIFKDCKTAVLFIFAFYPFISPRSCIPVLRKGNKKAPLTKCKRGFRLFLYFSRPQHVKNMYQYSLYYFKFI